MGSWQVRRKLKLFVLYPHQIHPLCLQRGVWSIWSTWVSWLMQPGLRKARLWSLVILGHWARKCSESDKSPVVGSHIYFVLGTLRNGALQWSLLFAKSRPAAACELSRAFAQHPNEVPPEPPPEPAVFYSTCWAVNLPLAVFLCLPFLPECQCSWIVLSFTVLASTVHLPTAQLWRQSEC